MLKNVFLGFLNLILMMLKYEIVSCFILRFDKFNNVDIYISTGK